MQAKNQLKRVLFICKNNSGRSQMAEAILRHLYGNIYEVHSAGTEPRPISPLTIKTLREIGIDASQQYSKSLENYQEQEFDLVVTLCENKDGACPVFLNGKKFLHHEFKDPASFKGHENDKLEYFQEIRDEIYHWIQKEFLVDNGGN